MLTIVDLWNRPYRSNHRQFHVHTEDGVKISGVHLQPRKSETLLLYVHGFMSNKNHRRVPEFVESLSEFTDVMAIDLRGHGASEGGCTMSGREVLDVEATYAYARSLGYKRLVSLGSSMGGATVIRHAALYQNVDAVATIGAFADPKAIHWPATDTGLKLLYTTGQFGQTWSYVTRGTRLDRFPHHDEPPYELVNRIAPRPLLIIHGEWDPTVHPRAARMLYGRAQEPKEIVIVPRGGHDHPHLTAGTARRVRSWLAKHDIL
jgi:fermentation-respiration switch protein FrsA (DUF1100 family)